MFSASAAPACTSPKGCRTTGATPAARPRNARSRDAVDERRLSVGGGNSWSPSTSASTGLPRLEPTCSSEHRPDRRPRHPASRRRSTRKHDPRAVPLLQRLTWREQQDRQARLLATTGVLPQHSDGRGRGVVVKPRPPLPRFSRNRLGLRAESAIACLLATEEIPLPCRLEGAGGTLGGHCRLAS